MHVTIGERRLVLHVRTRNGQFVAHAERAENGDPFGVECIGATEDEAMSRLTSWLDWQGRHEAALRALQDAERAYHRTIAGSAFAPSSEGSSPIEMQKESLEAVEAARARLDEIRRSHREADQGVSS